MIPSKQKILVAGLAGIAGLTVFLVTQFSGQNSDGLLASGTVEATEAQLGFQVAGRIEFIKVREGDAVKKDEVLARLDTRETEARLAQARTAPQGSRA